MALISLNAARGSADSFYGVFENSWAQVEVCSKRRSGLKSGYVKKSPNDPRRTKQANRRNA